MLEKGLPQEVISFSSKGEVFIHAPVMYLDREPEMRRVDYFVQVVLGSGTASAGTTVYLSADGCRRSGTSMDQQQVGEMVLKQQAEIESGTSQDSISQATNKLGSIQEQASIKSKTTEDLRNIKK